MQRIIEFFKMLYREEPDRPNVWINEWTDWLTVIAAALLIYQVLGYYRKSSPRKKKSVRVILTVVVWMHLISRYVLSRKFYDFGARLPLYSCSLSALIFAFAPLMSEKKLWQRELLNWAAFAGIYGGILAIGFSSPGVYLAPHITRTDYYVGHTVIILFGLLRVMDRKVLFDRLTLLISSAITFVYLVISRILDALWDTNFGFMQRPPEEIAFLNILPVRVYRVGVIVGYLTANALTWYCADRYLKKTKHCGGRERHFSSFIRHKRRAAGLQQESKAAADLGDSSGEGS